jgi:hypothetical protein
MWKFVIVTVVLLGFSSAAQASGPVPAVNTDMGCSVAGQVVMYNGTSLACLAPTRPSTTVASLPTCNSGTQGQMFLVTNALTPVALATVVGGGAVVVGVTCNGTNFIVQ